MENASSQIVSATPVRSPIITTLCHLELPEPLADFPASYQGGRKNTEFWSLSCTNTPPLGSSDWELERDPNRGWRLRPAARPFRDTWPCYYSPVLTPRPSSHQGRGNPPPSDNQSQGMRDSRGRGVNFLDILFASNWSPEQASFDAKLCQFDLEVSEGE